MRPRPGPYDREPRRPRRALWIAAISGGVLAILIAVTAATGGFASENTGPARIPLGKNVDQHRFQTTVLGGYWTKKKILSKTYRSMVARLRVTNTGGRPATLDDYLGTVIPLQAYAGGALSTLDTKAYSGGTETHDLPVGVPVDVLAHYTPNTGEEHTTRLTLRFCELDRRSAFFYQGHQIWSVACGGWSTLDPRQMVGPQAITGPGLTWQQKVQKAKELNRQGEAAHKKKVLSTEGITAQVDIPLKKAGS